MPKKKKKPSLAEQINWGGQFKKKKKKKKKRKVKSISERLGF